MWSKSINNKVRSISKNSDDYDKDYIKIKFNSDDELSLNKTIEVSSMTTNVRAAFHENNKYYPQGFLDKCLYKLKIIYKYYILIEFMFLKELMLIKQWHQKSVMFITITFS